MRSALFSSTVFLLLMELPLLPCLYALHDGGSNFSEDAISTERASEGDVSLKFPKLDSPTASHTFVHGATSRSVLCLILIH